MPLQATSGTASYDAFGGGAAVEPVYIEQIFQTYLYTGNSPSTQTITNGIDLATYGGMVWCKSRNYTYNHCVMDTARGNSAGNILFTNSTLAQQSAPNAGISSYNSNGFSLRYDDGWGTNEPAGSNIVSWTFRKQPKFFDVVTYSGSSSTQNIAHNLGSVPGCIIVKRTSGVEDWFVYHTSLGNTQYIKLNSTSAAASGFAAWNNTSPTSTQFTVLGGRTEVNAAGSDYVAYLFAHNAGGFGLTGTDNVISCGSATADGSGNATVNLGYEPQWILIKSSSEANGWAIVDTMRGLPADGLDRYLLANSSAAEAGGGIVNINATGFYANATLSASATYIYIAIRRGPMKVPTSGTSVFSPVARTGNGSATTLTSAGFPPDLYIAQERSLSSYFGANWFDRLRGASKDFWSAYTDREFTVANSVTGFDSMNGVVLGSDGGNTGVNYNGIQYANWNFRRAPSFFDEVCYTGNGTAGRTVNHNLGVAPELMIVKRRNSSSDASWIVYAASQGISAGGQLNSNAAFGSMLGYYQWNNTAPTASVFTLGDGATDVNNAAGTYVWYGFATCAGVSKCGTFTGNGSSQTINCGFTGGARFVMIKATSTTGDWMVADSARGIVSGSDPYLELNTTNAEVTGEDWLDTDSTGFVVNEVSGSNANTNGVTYIYLAIA